MTSPIAIAAEFATVIVVAALAAEASVVSGYATLEGAVLDSDNAGAADAVIDADAVRLAVLLALAVAVLPMLIVPFDSGELTTTL
jgi:hypothetical protein